MKDNEFLEIPKITAANVKVCPLKVNKKHCVSFCTDDCALYVGNFPHGNCAFYVTALKITSPQKCDS